MKPWHEHFTARFADPFLSSLLLFFIANQWQFFYVLFWSKYGADVNVLIARGTFSWQGALAAPIEAAIYALLYPKASHWIEGKRDAMARKAYLDHQERERATELIDAQKRVQHDSEMTKVARQNSVLTQEEWRQSDEEYRQAVQQLALARDVLARTKAMLSDQILRGYDKMFVLASCTRSRLLDGCGQLISDRGDFLPHLGPISWAHAPDIAQHIYVCVDRYIEITEGHYLVLCVRNGGKTKWPAGAKGNVLAANQDGAFVEIDAAASGPHILLRREGEWGHLQIGNAPYTPPDGAEVLQLSPPKGS